MKTKKEIIEVLKKWFELKGWQIYKDTKVKNQPIYQIDDIFDMKDIKRLTKQIISKLPKLEKLYYEDIEELKHLDFISKRVFIPKKYKGKNIKIYVKIVDETGKNGT